MYVSLLPVRDPYWIDLLTLSTKIADDCRFWYNGWCKNGINCPNRHGGADVDPASRSSQTPNYLLSHWQLVQYNDPDRSDPKSNIRFKYAYNCGINVCDQEDSWKQVKKWLKELQGTLVNELPESKKYFSIKEDLDKEVVEVVLRAKEESSQSTIINRTEDSNANKNSKSVKTKYNLEVYYYFGKKNSSGDVNKLHKDYTWQFDFHVEFEQSEGFKNLSKDKLHSIVRAEFEIYLTAIESFEVWQYMEDWKKQFREQFPSGKCSLPNDRWNCNLNDTLVGRAICNSTSALPFALKVSVRLRNVGIVRIFSVEEVRKFVGDVGYDGRNLQSAQAEQKLREWWLVLTIARRS